jgi:hypothetical protein
MVVLKGVVVKSVLNWLTSASLFFVRMGISIWLIVLAWEAAKLAKGNHNPVTKFRKGHKDISVCQPKLKPLTVKLDDACQHAILTLPKNYVEEWGNNE